MKNQSHAAAVFIAAIAATVHLGCSGGGSTGGCPDTPACGGNLVGTWSVVRACQYAPTAPDQPLTAMQYMIQPLDPVIAPVQPLSTTNGDWCQDLYYPTASAPDSGMSGIINVQLFHGNLPLTSGSVTFNADSTYTTSLVFKAPGTSHFSPPCLQTGGFSASCDQLQIDIDKFYNMTGYKVSGLTCASSSDGGCDCNYVWEVDLSDQGTWGAGDGYVLENSEPSLYTYNGKAIPELQPTVPVPAEYCVQGTELTMTGKNGTSLSGVLGLRSLILQSQ